MILISNIIQKIWRETFKNRIILEPKINNKSSFWREIKIIKNNQKNKIMIITMMMKIKFIRNLMKKRIINKIINKKNNIQKKMKVKINHHQMFLTMMSTILNKKKFMRKTRTLTKTMKSINGTTKNLRKTIMISSWIWIIRKKIRGDLVYLIMIAVQQVAKDH